MHLEAIIEQISRYPWWLWTSELRNALSDYDEVRLEMHLKAVIEHVWRCTSVPKWPGLAGVRRCLACM
jgi:hypothetical protein